MQSCVITTSIISTSHKMSFIFASAWNIARQILPMLINIHIGKKFIFRSPHHKNNAIPHYARAFYYFITPDVASCICRWWPSVSSIRYQKWLFSDNFLRYRGFFTSTLLMNKYWYITCSINKLLYWYSLRMCMCRHEQDISLKFMVFRFTTSIAFVHNLDTDTEVWCYTKHSRLG